jgi:predicted nucleic acid-binding protein
VEPIWGITAQRFVDAAEGRMLADVERDMAERAKELAGGRPSLLQDVMRGRRTEVQYLNGYVSEQGRQASDQAASERHVENLIKGVALVSLDRDISAIFGRERARLRRLGNLIADLDILIAASALRHDLTLLTNNRRDFERIEGLTIESV